MKDEIKKKIEEEALRRFPVNGIDYPKQLAPIQGYEKGYMDAMNEYHNTTCSCCHTKFNGQLFCIDCFEKGYSLAQQSVNSELIRFIEWQKWNYKKPYDTDSSEILNDYLSVFPASQNQQNEKAIDVNEFTKWFTDTLSEEEKNEFIQQNENPIDWNKLREEFFSECTDSYYINNVEVHREVCLSAKDTFNWFKNKIENNK